MEKYIFSTDIDGTVLMDSGIPHPDTIKSFKKAREKGHIVVLATGRNLISIKPVLEMIKEVDYLLCNNGAQIVDLKTNKNIFLASIKEEIFFDIFDFATEKKSSINLHTNKNYFQYPNSNHGVSSTIMTNKDVDLFKENLNKFGEINKGEKITQISLFNTRDFCDKYYPFLKNKFGEDNSVYLTNGVFIDINPKNISKWSGLKIIANNEFIDKNHIVTFGDSGNDYEMILKAGSNGYALSNSTKDLKEKIKPRIGSNNENSIAKKVLEYIN